MYLTEKEFKKKVVLSKFSLSFRVKAAPPPLFLPLPREAEEAIWAAQSVHLLKLLVPPPHFFASYVCGRGKVRRPSLLLPPPFPLARWGGGQFDKALSEKKEKAKTRLSGPPPSASLLLLFSSHEFLRDLPILPHFLSPPSPPPCLTPHQTRHTSSGRRTGRTRRSQTPRILHRNPPPHLSLSLSLGSRRRVKAQETTGDEA